MTLDRVSPFGAGNGSVGVSFSKSDLHEPFVIDSIEPDVSVEAGGGKGG